MTALVGFGSHGRDIAYIWSLCHGKPLGIYDENPQVAGVPPIPMTEDYLIGVNRGRRAIAERLGGRPAAPLNASQQPLPAHRNVVLAPGVVIAPGVTLLHDVQVGLHSHVNYNASLTRCLVGDYVTISPSVTICGDVEIEDDVWVGAGATVCDRTIIHKGAVIGAGAVVPPLTVIGPDELWLGVPARAVA
jgi:hypothetical protein